MISRRKLFSFLAAGTATVVAAAIAAPKRALSLILPTSRGPGGPPRCELCFGPWGMCSHTGGPVSRYFDTYSEGREFDRIDHNDPKLDRRVVELRDAKPGAWDEALEKKRQDCPPHWKCNGPYETNDPRCCKGDTQ